MRSKEYVRSLSSGAIHQTVYMPTVEAFEACIPERGQQERMESSLSRALEAADRVKTHAGDELGSIQALPSALLRLAFSAAL